MNQPFNYDVRPVFKATRDINEQDLRHLAETLGGEMEYDGSIIFFNEAGIGYNAIRLYLNNELYIPKKKEIQVICKTFIYKTVIPDACKPLTFEDMEYIYEQFEAVGLNVIKKAKRRDFSKNT